MKYDIIIVGGGLAGLYCAHRLTQTDNTCKILIFERNKTVGGRIDTVHGIEAGAGRFNNKHHRLLRLIDELGLTETIVPISNFEYFMENGEKHNWNKIYGLINKIDRFSPNPPNNLTFLKYANTIPGVSTSIDLLTKFYGYSSELTDMNARDAMALMKRHFNKSIKYYTMKGGLSQITRELVKRLQATGQVQILTHRRVTNIHENGDFEISCDGFSRNYVASKCICAVTKDTLLTIPIFRPIYPMLQMIKTLPLCRIYAKGVYDIVGDDKVTINNNLRIIIPIDRKTDMTMISYTDNKYAIFWRDLLDTKGMDAVNREHQRLLRETFKHDDIPLPRKTQVFYWEHGVAYFGPGFDSKTMPHQIMQPFKNIPLFVCGENYSEKNNQWMEGALDTSDYILERI